MLPEYLGNIYDNTFKTVLERKRSKVIFSTIEIKLLNWYLLGVEMNLGHGHKTRFWYLLWVLSKFSDEHPRPFEQ